MKHIGIALLNYHQAFHCLPPAYVTDADGKPQHTWRVVLLPYFEDGSLAELYSQYDFNEPWNGPNNRKLADKRPAVYCCPSDADGRTITSYLAVVGPETAWPAPQTMKLHKILDGMSTTIMVVETTGSGIHWMEPRDLTYEQVIAGIGAPQLNPRVSSKHQGGANVLFCDGSVHFLGEEEFKQVLPSMLTAAGGEPVEWPY